jgi:hypothetical protein
MRVELFGCDAGGGLVTYYYQSNKLVWHKSIFSCGDCKERLERASGHRGMCRDSRVQFVLICACSSCDTANFPHKWHLHLRVCPASPSCMSRFTIVSVPHHLCVWPSSPLCLSRITFVSGHLHLRVCPASPLCLSRFTFVSVHLHLVYVHLHFCVRPSSLSCMSRFTIVYVPLHLRIGTA